MTERGPCPCVKISKGRVPRGWNRFFLVVPSNRAGGKGQKVMHGKFYLNMRRTLQRSDWALEQIARRGWGVSFTGDTQQPSRPNPVQCSLAWPCWSREVGADDPVWWLPTQPILWCLDKEWWVSVFFVSGMRLILAFLHLIPHSQVNLCNHDYFVHYLTDEEMLEIFNCCPSVGFPEMLSAGNYYCNCVQSSPLNISL